MEPSPETLSDVVDDDNGESDPHARRHEKTAIASVYLVDITRPFSLDHAEQHVARDHHIVMHVPDANRKPVHAHRYVAQVDL